ncbi:MAG: hypothetical protein BWY57_03069 [Betaproteobacteria bacterium ADurb.Bin341]|nr:MAG: hypothetical protein BWY57_03069 [Betaproteobacteria bacterium ADurb.Bin341]
MSSGTTIEALGSSVSPYILGESLFASVASARSPNLRNWTNVPEFGASLAFTPRPLLASGVSSSLSVISSKARSKYPWTVPFIVVESIILLDCERTVKPFGPYNSQGKVVKLGG